MSVNQALLLLTLLPPTPALATPLNPQLDLANRLGIQGTPFLILNGEIWDRAIDLPSLEEAMHQGDVL